MHDLLVRASLDLLLSQGPEGTIPGSDSFEALPLVLVSYFTAMIMLIKRLPQVVAGTLRNSRRCLRYDKRQQSSVLGRPFEKHFWRLWLIAIWYSEHCL